MFVQKIIIVKKKLKKWFEYKSFAWLSKKWNGSCQENSNRYDSHN